MKDPGELTYRVIARNWADDSENRIHSDEVAAQYGFEGGLVPGVGVYSYMTRPVVTRFGAEWHARGAITARFIKPVYHDEEVCVTARRSAESDGILDLEVSGPDNDIRPDRRASGRAWLHDERAPEDPKILDEKYPRADLPAEDARPEASLEVLSAGAVLGSREITIDLGLAARTWVRDVRDDGTEYQPDAAGEGGAVCHPGLLAAQANYILRDNVRLGPWIHAQSEIRNFAPVRDGDPLSLRGRVARAWRNHGHEFVLLDLMMFAGDRPVQHNLHTAIIRPRPRSGAAAD